MERLVAGAHSYLRHRARLGPDFAKLWLGTALSSVGDGAVLAAGPLLIASLTTDPALVAGVAFTQQLPWILASLPAGAVVDRVDRRRLIVYINVLRCLVIGLLACFIAGHFISVPFVYATFFLVGVGDTLADNASTSMLPSIVPDELLTRANARVTGAFMVGNQLAGPAIGAALFAFAATSPFALDAASFLIAAVLVATLRWRPSAGHGEAAPSGRLLRTIREGTGWLFRHRLLRVLALAVCVLNITYLAAFGVLVLYAKQRLGTTDAGFGLLLTATGIGGLLGTLLVSRFERWFGHGPLLRAGLVVETASLFIFALNENVWVAGVTLLIAATVSTMWGVAVVLLRQRLVPDSLRGRVGSIYLLLNFGGAAVGALIGGFIARNYGIVAPFWAAGIGDLVLIAFVWRPVGRPTKDAPPSGTADGRADGHRQGKGDTAGE